MSQEYFTVELASEIAIGIPLADMGTVIQLELINICTVPGIARFWYGVVNFKGSLLWVLDSDRFLMPSLHEQGSKSRLATLGSSASCGETPNKGLSRMSAQHRFFDLDIPQKSPQKLTAVIIKNEQLGGLKKVALVTQKLKGVVSIEPSCLQPLADDAPLQLRECCSAIAQTETNSTYIIDSAAMLQKLYQQSSLISA